MDINESIDKIENKDDFLSFLHELNNIFSDSGKETWENVDLGKYLRAMEAFIQDSSDKSLYKIDFTPSWKLFARILLTASIYE